MLLLLHRLYQSSSGSASCCSVGQNFNGCFISGALYILGLVISIAIVFVCVGDLLDKRRFLGPSVLKTVLCMTPLLLLFLLNTAKDGENIKKWCPSCVFTRLQIFLIALRCQTSSWTKKSTTMASQKDLEQEGSPWLASVYYSPNGK